MTSKCINGEQIIRQPTTSLLNCTEASASAIKTAVELIDNAISGSEMQVDVVTLPDVVPAAKIGVVKTTDEQVKSSAGIVYAVLVSGIGVTAGDKVEIKNSTDASGTALITIVADAANGTWAFYPCVGITFGTGIYSDETKTGGAFTVTVVYA